MPSSIFLHAVNLFHSTGSTQRLETISMHANCIASTTKSTSETFKAIYFWCINELGQKQHCSCLRIMNTGWCIHVHVESAWTRASTNACMHTYMYYYPKTQGLKPKSEDLYLYIHVCLHAYTRACLVSRVVSCIFILNWLLGWMAPGSILDQHLLRNY